MIAIAIINFRTCEATLRCLEAVRDELPARTRVFVLDNGSGGGEAARLREHVQSLGGRARFVASDVNRGFAGGMNALLERISADADVEHVLFLNSDTRATPGFLGAMLAQVDAATCTEMVAARLLDEKSGNVDSLGIALYRSTLASNRKRDDEVLLGPTGGCALFTRRVLEDVRATHGEWFDERFFCYAEDTDLVLRARWLGYRAAYAAEAVVYHQGSLSSGGPDNDFVLYHGIRNSLWWLIKDAPSGWLLRSLPWFLLLHAGICARHLRRGRWRVLWRLYRDALNGAPAMWRKRRQIRATRRVPASAFRTWVEPRFYERDYVRRAWRELWRPASRTR